ncbi:MAG TPA: hypothetical protein VFC07_01270 [Verrucomicrobiae bacterium]|nr:hypothetical protein [Verrucomicrobiae bacterium]
MSPGTETNRVRIADWSGLKLNPPNEEETLPKDERQKTGKDRF